MTDKMRSAEYWNKLELYIISLWLLFLLIVIITADIPICFGRGCEFIGWRDLILRNVAALTATFFIVLGGIFYLRFENRVSGSKRLPQKVTKVEDSNYEHLVFLTTYIIPLIAFNLTSVRYLFALMVLLLVIGVIYIKTDKFYANPTLAVLGFRLYRVDLQSRLGERRGIIIITRDRISEQDQIRTFKLDERVCFARRVNDDRSA